MHSALYRGWLDHRRVAPRAHAFRYPLFMVYLDLAELDQVFRGRWMWSTRRAAFARFDRRDHLGDPAVPLDAAVRTLVRERVGRVPTGPIRLLTHLRYAGYGFNPVSFYYCFDAADRQLEAVVAEVNNTPWGERHCYVLSQRRAGARTLRARTVKAMHVSPFHAMDLTYDWIVGHPDERLTVHMTLRPGVIDRAERESDPAPIFGATLSLRREPVTGAALARALMRFPLMTAQVIGAIHWQALRLWMKRIPVHIHPARTSVSARPSGTALPDPVPLEAPPLEPATTTVPELTR